MIVLACIAVMVIRSVDSALGAGPESANFLPLSGADWWIHDDPTGSGQTNRDFEARVPAAGWIRVQVPGNIQADVERAHKLRPIWYGATDPNLYEIARKDWWYRKEFLVPAAYTGKRLTLVFDGVDERCEVWLNGQKIGGNAGMFRRFEFDVSEWAQPGQTNRLGVWIARMPEELVPLLVNSDGPGEKDPFGPYGFMTGVNKTRERLKDLKTPGNFSYDWAFNVWTLGIWKDVRLEATGPARIQWTRVETTSTNDYASAIVRAALEVESSAELAVKAVFQVTGSGRPMSKTIATALKKSRNLILAEIPLNRPSLWWPNGHGEQPLYTLHAELVSAEGVVSDSRSTRFGVRDIRWVHTEGAPTNYINRYQLVINGRKVRTIGTGLILPGVLPACVSEHNLRLLHQAKACGMNTLRINGGGGGPLFDERWYNLADELGIMIQYEFPIGNSTEGRPETDAAFLTNLELTCRSMIKASRNHPSIIEYGGGNEMEWDENSKHPALAVMRKVAIEENDRLFRATSPDLGGKHAPWDFDILGGNTGYGGSYSHYNGFLQSTKNPGTETMSYSEFGTCSPSHEEVWHRDAPLASQWPLNNLDDPVLIRKNATRAVFSPEHWLVKKRIDAVFGAPDNLHDLIAAGQYLGADGLRYIYDELRRRGRRLANITSHCFSEPCPNLAGSYLVDHAGRTLMNYDFLKQALAPISLSLRMESALYALATGIKTELFLVSDAPHAASGLRWKWLARDRLGKVFARNEGTADIQPLEVKSLGTLTLQPTGKVSPGLILVELRLEAADGKLLTERLQVFGDRGTAGPLAGLLRNRAAEGQSEDVRITVGSLTAPKPAHPVRRTTLAVKASASRIEGDQEVYALRVKNNGPMTALFCEPHPLLVYRTDLFIDNNNCFIPPDETRVITIRATRQAQSGLSLAQNGWRISCWNADDLTVAPSEDVVLSVGRQDQLCREYQGYFEVSQVKDGEEARCTGARPDTAQIPYRMAGASAVRFEFDCARAQARRPSRLRIHTADQSDDTATVVEVTLNGRTMAQTLPKGLGIQRTDPAHLAFPATIEFDLRGSELRPGKNTLSVRAGGNGWFTWDALDLVSRPHEPPRTLPQPNDP
jgi:beta-mannosidase